jgi:cytochrome c oxidase subunit 4
MSEQVITTPAVPPKSEHAGGHDSSGHNSPEQIKKEIRVYLMVFGALTVLTAATVGVIYLGQMPVHIAIAIALAIASMKGFLVAGFFMHLLSEKKLIYSLLVLTAIFFVFLLALPMGAFHNTFGK